MRIAIAQVNATVGDIAGNVERIVGFAARARDGGAHVVVTPELAICGYPPEDLLQRDDFLLACADGLDELLHRVRGITLVVGHPRADGLARYNSASVLRDGHVVAVYDKTKLPNYTVFDEQRYFEPGTAPCVFTAAGERLRARTSASARQEPRVPPSLAVNICADAWDAQPPRAARAAGASVLIVLNASPYHVGKHDVRLGVMRERAAETGLAIVYVNLVGGQDEFVFDGASFVMDPDGRLTHQLPAFEEALAFVDIERGIPLHGPAAERREGDAEIYGALTLGLRDYIRKNHFPGALVGLAGDLDSALALTIAADAIGPANVCAVLTPGGHSSEDRLADARTLAARLGVTSREIGLEPLTAAYRAVLGSDSDAATQTSLQRKLELRIRATLLMALSNETGALVLATGNKSALATGDATMYGDTAGGFAVLKDIDRPLVARLSRYRNRLSPVIPVSLLEPQPVEVLAEQRAADAAVDAIVEAYVEDGLTPAQIVARGYAISDVERVAELVRTSEYKRRQAPIGVRITSRAFGKDWRYPITNRYRHRLG